MKIYAESIPVDDQDHALDFYTRVLGFVVKDDQDMGGGARWLTLTAPEQPDGPLLLLEPNGGYPEMKALKKALYRDGIAATMFQVDDLTAEVARLTDLGVTFRTPPTDFGTVTFAVFDDTCGNLINIFQSNEQA